MSPDFKLPALRHLGELADREPVIVIDSREQLPLIFNRFKSIRGTLTSGDYSVAGLEEVFAIERKSVSDLVSCCSADRERFKRELHRLRGFRFKRLLIVGSQSDIKNGNYGSRMSPAAVFATPGAFEARYDRPVIFRTTPESAALQIEQWAFRYSRELVESVNNTWRGLQ